MTFEEKMLHLRIEAMKKGYDMSPKRVIDALRKQIVPMKPVQDLRKGIECYCPVCGGYVGWRDALARDLCNYCSECGQKIGEDDE